MLKLQIHVNFKPDGRSYGHGFHMIKRTEETSQPLLSRLRVSQQWQYAKTIVKAARYPVNSMQGLWELLTKHHKEELPDLIKLSQIALTLPLHTASCERVFSQQNLILTKQRSRLAPATCDKLLRTRLASNAGVILNFEDCLQHWHWLKRG